MIAVLEILITAPLGAALIKLTGPRLLRKSKERKLVDENEERRDLTCSDDTEFTSEDTKSKERNSFAREIMMERETVT